MSRAAAAARFVAFATALYILMLSAAPARAWHGPKTVAAPQGALAQALAELGGSSPAALALGLPMAVAVAAAIAQAVSRATSR